MFLAKVRNFIRFLFSSARIIRPRSDSRPPPPAITVFFVQYPSAPRIGHYPLHPRFAPVSAPLLSFPSDRKCSQPFIFLLFSLFFPFPLFASILFSFPFFPFSGMVQSLRASKETPRARPSFSFWTVLLHPLCGCISSGRCSSSPSPPSSRRIPCTCRYGRCAGCRRTSACRSVSP